MHSTSVPATYTPSGFLNSLFKTLSAVSADHEAKYGASSPLRGGLRRNVKRPDLQSPSATGVQSTTDMVDEQDVRISRTTSNAEMSPRNLPQEAKDALQTLHVLFPHVLLDALDLLGKGCVVRATIATDVYEDEVEGKASEHHTEPQASTGRKRKRKAERPTDRRKHSTAYYVLSARAQGPSSNSTSTSKSRYARSGGGADQSHASVPRSDAQRQSHHVHLRAWNCSCPAFAFAAFSNTASSVPLPARAADVSRDPPVLPTRATHNFNVDEEDGTLVFGGQSLWMAVDVGVKGQLDMKQTREVLPPVCKHLMACLLGELCPGLFGPFDVSSIQERDDPVAKAGWDMNKDIDGRTGVQEIVIGLDEAAGIAGSGAASTELLNGCISSN